MRLRPLENEQNVPDLLCSSFGRWQWWCFFSVMLLVVFASGCYQMVNGDIWWHLKAGELILETGTVPRRNLFAYTNPESVWIDLHWLFQVIVARIYQEFGTRGLVAWKAMVGCFAFSTVFLTSYKRLPGALAAFCWLPFVWIYAGRFHVRPEMLSHLYLGATLWMIHLHHHGKTRWIWMLVPIQLAWVNSQGLFILQHCVLGAYALNEQFCNLPEIRLNRVWYVLLACVVATFVNPYGLDGAIFPLELLQKVSGPNREMFQLLAGETTGMAQFLESYGLNGVLDESTTRLMLLTAPLCLGLSFVGSLKRYSMTLYRWCLLFGFGYLAWNMNRNASLYAIVWGYVLVSVLGDWYVSKPWRDRGEDLTIGILRKSLITLGFIFLVLQLLSSVIDILGNKQIAGTHYPPRYGGFGEDNWYHHDAAKFIAELPGVDNVYSQYNGTGFAGVIIYHGFGREQAFPKRVFADARLEANSVDVLKDFLKASLGGNSQSLAEVEGVLSEYSGTSPALVYKNYDLMIRKRLLEDLVASGKWRSVYMSTTPNIPEGVTIFVPDDVVKKYQLETVSVGVLRN